MESNGEQWKPIPAYPQYMVSDHGNVKREARQLRGPTGKLYNYRERMCSPAFNPRAGVVQVYLNGTTHPDRHYAKTLACIVAEAFLDNPERRKHVQQLDGDVMNCHVDNLVWRHPTPKRNYHAKEKAV